MCRIDLEGTFQIAEPGDLGRPVIYLPPKHHDLRPVGVTAPGPVGATAPGTPS